MRWGQLSAACVLGTFLMACGGGGGGGGGGSDDTEESESLATVRGTVTARAATVMDGDTNDPDAPYEANNDQATAQPLPNPARVGGFIAVDGTAFGGLAATPDPADFYEVSLASGQAVSLRISDYVGTSSGPDLDLHLYAEGDASPTQSSATSQATESIDVAQDGTYFVEVAGVTQDTETTYVLTVGQSSGTSATGEPEFVAGEAIVRFEPATLPQSATDAVAYRAERTGLRAKAGSAGGPLLMALPERRHSRAAALGGLGVAQRDIERFAAAPADVRRRHETRMAVKALRRRDDVASADLNYIHRAQALPNDNLYLVQWHLPMINLPQAWDIQTGADTDSEDVTVAVLDTGVYLQHEDLENVVAGGYDFVDGDADPNDPGGTTPGSSSFHGTHVAGTIAAETHNIDGVAGVSWGATVMPVRVLDGNGSGTGYDILQGVRYAAGLANDSGNTSAAADIINLSLGCIGCYSETAEAVYQAAREQGVMIVAAAGNEGTTELGYPASYDGVISVSAVDINKELAPYSNYGSEIDIAAPGGNTAEDENNDGNPDGVLSTVFDDAQSRETYAFYNGTSMAAPHVAGVLALMKAENPAAVTPDNVDAWLEAGDLTEQLQGAAGERNDQYGYGLVDAHQAVETASSSTVPASLEVDPSSIDFGASESAETMTLSHLGDGTLTIDSVTDDADWLEVAAPTGGGLGDYDITATRTADTEAGVYSATIEIAYTADGSSDMRSIPATMRVADEGTQAGNTGFNWILLIDPDTGETVASAKGTVHDSLDYEIADVPPGEYYVLAGSDSDFDFVICDPGEACGAYRSVSELETVVVGDDDVEGIDIITNFGARLNAASMGSAPKSGFRRPGGKRVILE